MTAPPEVDNQAILYSNRGRWDTDEVPCGLRFITPDRVVSACALAQRGRLVACTLPTSLGAPPSATTRLQAAASLDAPIAARGVLLDVARCAHRAWLADGTEICASDLDECAERQGVTIESGDVLLVRTGMLSGCASLSDWRTYREGPAPGLARDCARWLYEREAAVVATDTPWVEVHRPDQPAGALCRVSLHHTGVVFGESFYLEALSEACAADGNYAFLFVCAAPDASGAARPFAVK